MHHLILPLADLDVLSLHDWQPENDVCFFDDS